MDCSSYLDTLSRQSRERFVAERRVLSFDQYLSLLADNPGLLGRNAAQYLKDTLDFYGTSETKAVGGDSTRFNLFDTPFDDGRERLIGQEEVQQTFYQLLSDFVREGKTGKLVLIHGPNGSAKTSFVQCLARALVHYSRTAEGAQYSFNWVFARSSYLGKRLGFDSAESGDEPEQQESYAFLDEQNVAALIPGGLRDHPIFLLPREERQKVLTQLIEEGNIPEGFRFSDHLLYGDLSPTSRKVFDTLLAAYNGDISRVLAHVQVERFYLSRRYRQGIVTIDPQMHIDASIRQITMDESYANLPPVLRHLSMFEASGDLVDANRGLLEFSDLLKRPVDTFKYLLGTCESSKISVGEAILYLDIVFVGTTNDKYMEAFTRTPDFSSFKGRIEVVRMPYIRDYSVEKQIYDMQVTREVVGKHIAPHSTYVAALWAVLTRMKKCVADQYPETIKAAVAGLSPLEKADLYATGQSPSGHRPDVARELAQAVETIYEDSGSGAAYEGSFGASPREIKGVLLAAAHSSEFECVHPVRVFHELEELMKQQSLYEFLQIAPDGEYHATEALLGIVRSRYISIVDREFKQAMGLVTDDDFVELLRRYATHASAHLKKESVVDPTTRAPAPPDKTFMRELEDRWDVTDETRERHREDFIGRIASFSLDHPGRRPSFKETFPTLFEKLKTAYFEQAGDQIRRTMTLVLSYLDGATLRSHETETAEKIVENMITMFGYCRGCIGPALSILQD